MDFYIILGGAFVLVLILIERSARARERQNERLAEVARAAARGLKNHSD